jgi:predicted acylesterase/phospholipase RssA
MTLTGFLPPMTDEEGNMLVDGGYMDNLTVFVSQTQMALILGCYDERYGSGCDLCGGCREC